MPQTINTNIVSLNAQRNLNGSQSALAVAMQRLSSGLRVNSAKDDAAGLAIAERMNSQVRGMNVAIRNANDGISLAQTAEGALGKLGDMLQRMRELAVQSRNSTNSDGDRTNLQREFTQLQEEMDRVIKSSNFNSKALFDGTAGTLEFQVGANAAATDRISIASIDLLGSSITAASAIDTTGTLAADADVLATVVGIWDGSAGTGVAIGGVSSAGTAVAGSTEIDNAINVIDRALGIVNDKRAIFGAVQNRFEAVIGNLQTAAENQTAARSRIMDADFAAETAMLSRAQILQQAGNAMVAQANQLPQQVLQLLGR
ncbi:flagellin [uncultured Methylibium sp.]|uniref:flagellin N-terminal helical domain-containing protein n=1 Tax=uncultured Methylibium sp. TaxID=381093 RepID=UPI0025D4C325|nr:flagellin [uncultured Methylibium sp.]